MSNINFTGWVIADSEGELLKVVRAATPSRCDCCNEPAGYWVVVPSGDVSPMCHECLDASFEDPTSPDEFYAPAKRNSYVHEYWDGARELTIRLGRH